MILMKRQALFGVRLSLQPRQLSFFFPTSGPGCPFACSCHVSLVYSNWEQFLHLSLYFTCTAFLRIVGRVFCQMFFHLVHLRFADAVHSWQAHPRSDVGSFSEYPIGGHMMPIGLNTGDVNWFSWFRWGLPGVCTLTMLFSQSCYIYRPVDLPRFAHGWKPRGHRLYVCFSHHCVVSSCHHVSYFVGAQQHLLSK